MLLITFDQTHVRCFPLRRSSNVALRSLVIFYDCIDHAFSFDKQSGFNQEPQSQLYYWIVKQATCPTTLPTCTCPRSHFHISHSILGFIEIKVHLQMCHIRFMGLAMRLKCNKVKKTPGPKWQMGRYTVTQEHSMTV